ncbi:Alpha/Beta hydrolase protein [Dactylonectria macrodidyma]|uniref:Alpha/Beta hydrolase protein n=1 Tax=Dactylonectria macrodidyma TaxID=307937 RepID=A0A9P9FV70_9HYPO|nr:Alpha/Beta hydrolase protein [Dactylonectria macrodidyma]
MEPAHLPNTCQYTAKTDRGDYIVQVAWPLIWGEDRVPQKEEPVNTLYVVDGNAYFFTAVDVTRRLEFTNGGRTVVVGIGYPNKKCVYDHRRGPDLTPPAADGKYDIPLDAYGQKQDHLPFGEASKFLATIETSIMPHVQDTLFPKAGLGAGRKALFGHSYGGIFVLNALYTKPEAFDTFIAASPVTWWNHDSILKEQEPAFRARTEPVAKPPALLLTYGSTTSEVKQADGEADKTFAARKAMAEDDKMTGVVAGIAERLKGSPHLRSVWTWKFEGEDHGSSSVTAVQQGIIKFLTEPHIG